MSKGVGATKGSKLAQLWIDEAIAADRANILAYLVEKGVIREHMFAEGWLVAYTDHLIGIDIPADMSAWLPKQKKEESND